MQTTKFIQCHGMNEDRYYSSYFNALTLMSIVNDTLHIAKDMFTFLHGSNKLLVYPHHKYVTC